MDCSLNYFSGFTENCRAANEIYKNTHKYKKISKDIVEGSTERGTLEALLDHGQIKKISVTHYGEMGYRNLDVFFDKENPILLSDETTYYDRPIYIEGFKVVSKTLLYYLFKNGSIFESTPGANQQPQKVSPEVDYAIREEIDAYIKLVEPKKTD